MSNTKPTEEFPRRILLAVTGMSPQIITETLYALACVRKPSFVPTEIHLITTVLGKRNAELELLDEKHGQLAALCEDYGLNSEAIAFDPSHIHLVHDASGPLPDIRSEAANNAAADLINKLVREFCADENAAVHASIAGGRKTMGFYLGYCMSLHGRDQDELSHVLVNEPFESNRSFFYPPKPPKVIRDRNDQPWRTSDAQITLADIPFVRMRHGLAKRLTEAQHSFSDTIALADKAMRDSTHVLVDIPNRCLVINDVPIKLPDTELAVYSYFAGRAIRGDTQGLPRVGIDLSDWDEYVAVAERVSGISQRIIDLEANKDSDEYFNTPISRIKTRLRKELGATIAEPYFITKQGKHSQSRHGLFRLQPEQIEIIE